MDFTENIPDLPVPPVARETEEMLDDFPSLMSDDYATFKKKFIQWLLTEGKDTRRKQGYAASTVRNTHYKIEQAYRWLWSRDESYSKDFTPDDADELVWWLLSNPDYGDVEILDFTKALKRLFSYFTYTRERTVEWEIPDDVELHTSTRGKTINYFKKWELRELYEGALRVGSMKSYHNKNMSADERDRLKIHLAERFEKPKDEIGPEDFKRANSWKLPSIFAVSIDMGLRPIEVGRATLDWIDFSNQQFVIPTEDSTKSEEPWECVLSSQGVTALQNWLIERENYEKYQGRDEIWLTKYSNSYGSKSLNDLLKRVIAKTTIEPGSRQLSWYAIRRGVATVWANDENLEDAMEQLRHKRHKTTLRYVQSSSSRRAEQADSKW